MVPLRRFLASNLICEPEKQDIVAVVYCVSNAIAWARPNGCSMAPLMTSQLELSELSILAFPRQK